MKKQVDASSYTISRDTARLIGAISGFVPRWQLATGPVRIECHAVLHRDDNPPA